MSLPTAPFRKLFWQYAWVRLLDPRLIEAVAMTESSGDPKAKREEPQIKDRSRGLMQLLERTARGLGYPEGKSFDDLYDPATNIQYGVKLLCELIDGVTHKQSIRMDARYAVLQAPFPEDIRIALARYNGGFKGNPAKDGQLRNGSYVLKVEGWFRKVETDTEAP